MNNPKAATTQAEKTGCRPTPSTSHNLSKARGANQAARK